MAVWGESHRPKWEGASPSRQEVGVSPGALGSTTGSRVNRVRPGLGSDGQPGLGAQVGRWEPGRQGA